MCMSIGTGVALTCCVVSQTAVPIIAVWSARLAAVEPRARTFGAFDARSVVNTWTSGIGVAKRGASASHSDDTGASLRHGQRPRDESLSRRLRFDCDRRALLGFERRDCDGERTAASHAARDGDRSAVRLRDPLADREAKADAGAFAAARPRAIDAPEEIGRAHV